jgi:4-hydroxymandelate oxidase
VAEITHMDSRDFDALEDRARDKLPPGAFAFAAGGADDEVTLADNIAAWRRLRLRPRMLRDVTAIDASVSVLGERIAAPLIAAPTGRHKLFHPDGERATARGAAAAGVPYVMATNSTVTMEDAAAERTSAPQWFQLYLPPDRSITEGLVDRAAAAGFRAVVLTVDQPVYGASPRAARAPLAASDMRAVNLPGQPLAAHGYGGAHSGSVTYPATFDDLAWLVQRSPLPILVKGILRGDDAARCVELGAKGVIVSNHGGRHLDAAVATADALPEVAAALGGKAEVYVDGGIRRGTDIVKAIALGARAVLIGRPAVWGLALGGADGVRDVFAHLRGELMRTMALCGVAKVGEITRDLVT